VLVENKKKMCCCDEKALSITTQRDHEDSSMLCNAACKAFPKKFNEEKRREAARHRHPRKGRLFIARNRERKRQNQVVADGIYRLPTGNASRQPPSEVAVLFPT